MPPQPPLWRRVFARLSGKNRIDPSIGELAAMEEGSMSPTATSGDNRSEHGSISNGSNGSAGMVNFGRTPSNVRLIRMYKNIIHLNWHQAQ